MQKQLCAPIVKLIGGLIFCLTWPAIPAAALDPSVSVQLISCSEDHAGTQGVFGPGPDFAGNILNDFHWQAELTLGKTAEISSVLVEHYIGGEPQAWTTASIRYHGKDIYPLVIYRDGLRLNDHYDARFGPWPAGSYKLDLYGQMESKSFLGGRLEVTFLTGEIVSAPIPAAAFSLEPLSTEMLSCADSDGLRYDVKGQISYSTGQGAAYSYEDRCLDQNRVAEGVCGGRDGRARQFVISHGLCSAGCEDGRCSAAGAQSDFDYSIAPLRPSQFTDACRFGWQLTLKLRRQKAIQFLDVRLQPDDAGNGYPGQAAGEEPLVTEQMKRLRLFYRGRPFFSNYQFGDRLFEPGEHVLLLCPEPDAGPSGSAMLKLIFADGSGFSIDLAAESQGE